MIAARGSAPGATIGSVPEAPLGAPPGAPPQVLSPGRLLAGLVAHGLDSGADALGRGVILTDLSRSNPVTAVAVGGKARLVVKQRGLRVDEVDPMTAETAAYAWLSEVGLALIAPALGAVGDGWLALEAVEPATSLHELVVRRAPASASAFAALGDALGRLHAAPVPPVAQPGSAGGLVPRRPWILDLEPRGLPSVVPAAEGVTAVRERLLASRSVAALLGGLRASWSGRAIIHGDVKFDNVLVQSIDGLVGGDDGPAARVWLIDWELAGLGEPAWDLAGCVEGVVTAQFMTAGRVDVPSAAPLALAALEAHARADGGLASLTAPAVVLRWTAARLAQASLQLAAMAGEDAAAADRARDIADLAISFAEEPRAWGSLVGIPVAATA